MMATIGSLGAMRSSLEEMRSTEISRAPSAVLADKGITDGQDITLATTFYDQRQDECTDIYAANNAAAIYARQYEWTSCGYTAQGSEEGTVDYYLGTDALPVASGGKLLSNRGIADMKRWWTAVAGKSREHAGRLKLKYNATESEFSYKESEFYPLDKLTFSDGDPANADGHNHFFTMSTAIPISVTARGSERFTIRADDDTYVYVNNRLALDMGGIHDVEERTFVVTRAGEVYTGIGDDLAYSGITVQKDEKSIIRIFHADRDSGTGSTLEINMKEMKPETSGSAIAMVKSTEGVPTKELATETADGYVAPLGQSVTIQHKGNIRAEAIMATTAGIILMLSVCFGTMLIARTIKARIKGL
ncbi:hypothetical protein IKE72_02125 [Candidatus Saccharibacteria bacterium]|nr:hypothetical protein [Candidatus Saccharibacteria bacterium]